MKKPKMNYSPKNGINVLCDKTYPEPIGICKDCKTKANLDKGLCEACYLYTYNINGNKNNSLTNRK